MSALPIDPFIVPQIYYWAVFLVCLFLFFNYSGSDNCDKLLQQNSMVPALILTLLLMVYMGLRPVSSAFGDTINYAAGYRRAAGMAVFSLDLNKEWLWAAIMLFCKQSGLTVNAWFLLIEIGYLGFAFIGLRILLKENCWIAMLFFLSAFSTFTFGVNGIRNGLACSMVICAFAVAANQNFSKLALAGVILLLAFGIHRSISLPIAAFLAASYVIKSPKIAIYFWIASIGVSLVAGGAVTNFFMGLGFDDRMTQYGTGMGEFGDQFSNTGFRWDFIIYSSFPIILGYYTIIKKGFTDKTYSLLLNTYIFSNAFWVLINSAAYSNRFAYLSWFLFPILIAYPICKFRIFPRQGIVACLILFISIAFTFVMQI